MYCVSLHRLQSVTLYIKANQVYTHLITIRIKMVTNTVMALKDTITTYRPVVYGENGLIALES